jgi:hypothetical protein
VCKIFFRFYRDETLDDKWKKLLLEVQGKCQSHNGGDVKFIHTLPNYSDVFPYIETLSGASRHLEKESSPKQCFIGHTHVPKFFGRIGTRNAEYTMDPNKLIHTKEYTRFVVVVPSVGQPRDEDTRTGWVEFDTEKQELTQHRLEYDVDAVITDMARFEFPEGLKTRMGEGK